MLTLWDFVAPIMAHLRPRKPRPQSRAIAPRSRLTSSPSSTIAPAAPGSMQARYDEVVAQLLEQHAIRPKRWRKRMSGLAWQLKYEDGSIKRFLESPYPRGPMSMAIFLHEVGHHAIGFNRFKPRCLEEYHAWAWSLTTMEQLGLNVTDSVRFRMHISLWYAISKARRRGLKELPVELLPFVNHPARVRPAKAASARTKHIEVVSQLAAQPENHAPQAR